MTTGIVSPAFIGRYDQRQLLVDLMRAAVGGTAGIAMVGGEAGVGKSRLVEEILAEASTLDLRVLVGNCVQLGADGLPFAPLVDALRGLARSMPPEQFDAVLGPARRTLLRLVPSLDPDFSAAHEPDVAGPRLLELVLGLIERLAADQPVVIVIEDLHWADQSTLDLVAYLVRMLRDVPVVMIGTFRSDELSRHHPMRTLLTAWERSRTVQRIELTRFDRSEVSAQLTAILGGPPDAAVLDTIFDRSEGNAFLVEELLGVVRAGDDPADLPQSLRDVLLARVDTLGPDAQRLLRAAAVGGPWVSERVLIEVSGLDEAAAFEGLREAVENHLLVVDGTGRGYSFRHALARDAVYAEMLPGERGRLHGVYGHLLSEHPELAGDDLGAVAADLAHHWYEALDLPRALAASVQAAAHASGRYAPAEAAQHLERALRLWPRVSEAEQIAGMDHVDALAGAAHAAIAAGTVQRSLVLLDEALKELGDRDDPTRHARLLERKAEALGSTGNSAAAVEVLTEALGCLSAGDDTVTHAVVLAALAGAQLREGELASARRTAERAVTTARATGAAQEEAEAQITLSTVTTALGLDGGAAMGRAGISQALAGGSGGYLRTALRGYINLSDSLEQLGRSAEAIEETTHGLALAQRVGYGRSLGAYLAGNRAESLLHIGRWVEADELIAATMADEPEGVFAATVLEVRGLLAALSGRYAQALADVEQAREWMSGRSEWQFVYPFAFTRAEVLRAGGELDAAYALISRSLGDAHLDAITGRYAWPLVWSGTRVWADLAVRARDRREDPAPMTAGITRALESIDVVTDPARGYRATALAELTRVDDPVDPGSWDEAVAAWRVIERPYQLAYCLLRRAEGQAGRGERPAAEGSAGEAHALAARIGARPLVTELEQLARRARLDLGAEAVAAPADPVVPDQLERYGLTQREREVLQMLAAGRSNPQIAQRLFISPKTASVHVSNILAKLGVTGRGEAAALAHRSGLADPVE